MKILGADEPVVHGVYFFPNDITLFGEEFKASFSNDDKFMVMFTFDSDTQEFPALVVDVLDYIKETDIPCASYLDILTFDNHGIQLGVLTINSKKIDIRQVIPIINKSLDESFTYNEWLENPSRPSVVADSDMTAYYIVHMMKLFLHCEVKPSPMDNYGNKANPLRA
jgi:hypothetical protein